MGQVPSHYPRVGECSQRPLLGRQRTFTVNAEKHPVAAHGSRNPAEPSRWWMRGEGRAPLLQAADLPTVSPFRAGEREGGGGVVSTRRRGWDPAGCWAAPAGCWRQRGRVPRRVMWKNGCLRGFCIRLRWRGCPSLPPLPGPFYCLRHPIFALPTFRLSKGDAQ